MCRTAATAYGRLISAYRASDVSGFNAGIREYEEYLSKTIPEKLNRPKLEFLFNQAQPFLQAMILYVFVLVFGLFSWLVWPKTLGKTAVILLMGAFRDSHARVGHPHVFARTTAGHQPL